MAVKKVIEIVAETAAAAKDIQKLFKDLLTKQEEANKQQEEINNNVKDLGDTAKGSRKGLEGIAKGFKGVGLAIKAAGIGLIIGLLSTLKDVFFQNQKVADAFATSAETVSIVFNEIVSVFTSVIEKVSKSSNGFEALGKVLKGVLTLGITPLKIAFLAITSTIKQAQLAWEKSFFGDKDPKTIKDLTKDIEEIDKQITQAGKDAVQAGIDIAKNAGGAVKSIADVVSGSVKGISDINVESALALAKLNVNLKNTAMLAAAQQGRLVEIYDRQAEKLRQIRDNELTSIADRTKANDALKEVLDNQEKAMLAQAGLQIAAAQAAANKNNNIENQVALTEALANKEGILAQIEGFRSEQDVNRNALIKERIDLKNAESEADSLLSLDSKRFNAELIKDDEARLEKLRELILEEKEIEKERLEGKVEQYAEGTQARTDAEIELKQKMHEIDQEYTLLGVELSDTRTKKSSEEAAQKIKDEEDVAKAKQQIQQYSLDVLSQGIGFLKQMAGENAALQKALLIAESAAGIAKIVINTNAANAAAKLKYALLPGGVALAAAEVTLNKISAGIGIASTIAATAKGLQSIGGGGSAPQASGMGRGGRQSAEPPQPSFNLVGNSQANQLAGAINQNGQPIQAFVVSRNMSSQQEMDRNIRSTASVG